MLSAYDIYRHCMYKPTREKYEEKLGKFIKDVNTGIYACLYNDRLAGMIVITKKQARTAEIMGIAVDETLRRRGIGTFMIRCVTEAGIETLMAETDDEAVGFYRKTGFEITEFTGIYNGEPVVRYQCVLNCD